MFTSRFRFMPRSIRFADSANDTGAGSTQNNAGDPPPTAGDNGTSQDEGKQDQDSDEDGNKESEKKFSQADLDRIVAERLARERAKTAGKKSGDNSSDSAEDVDTKISSAVEKALAENNAKSNAALVREAVKSAAAAAGFVDPSIAATLLSADSANPLAAVAVEDFTADTAKVAELVAELAKTKPFLVGKPTPIPGVGRTSGTTHQSLDSLSPRELLKRGIEEAQTK